MKSEYFYEGGLLRYEKRGNTELYFRYNGNGHLAAIQHYDNSGTANSYYVTTNFQGDVVGLYSGSGELLVSYEYDEWGNATINNPSGLAIAELNPIRYRGYYYDSETGLYYLQSRYYDPEICRFLNADNQLNSDMLGCNVYAYCSNNSVNCSDPTGHAWYHWAIGAAIVAACAVAVVATAGGIAPAIAAVASVANGMAAATTASTIAAGAFVSSATVYGTLAVSAAMCSTSVSDFNEQGDWGTVAATGAGAAFGGLSGLNMSMPTKPQNVNQETFLPDDYYNKNYAPKCSAPNSSIVNYKYNSYTNQFEKSKACYDFAGRQVVRVDFTNHGRLDHANPHVHYFTYDAQYPCGKEIRWD